MTAQTYPRVVIRPSTYRRAAGFTVTLYTGPGQSCHHQPSVFVETRQAADKCKIRFLTGEEITAGDMAA